ncbi:MAG: TRAP transporter small permease subunit [Candidatus Adiutrix sp.]|jgi:TRAP-type mannitol/chloroaromatic compound transport system permease small subunit|nr:TRAP transporter small permease subunit [Candidatus Adiutrix sp.]
MKKFIAGVEALNDIVGKVCSYSILVMMLLVVYEIFTRRVLNTPTVWTFEAITMAYGFHFMMVIAYTLLHKSIVNVDLLYNRLNVKNRARLDLITYLVFFFPFVGGAFIYSLPYAADSWMTLEKSWSVFAPPLYPFKTVIPVAFGLLLLQGLAEFLKRILVLKGDPV